MTISNPVEAFVNEYEEPFDSKGWRKALTLAMENAFLYDKG